MQRMRVKRQLKRRPQVPRPLGSGIHAGSASVAFGLSANALAAEKPMTISTVVTISVCGGIFGRSYSERTLVLMSVMIHAYVCPSYLC